MCGIIGFVGKLEPLLAARLIHESEIRGTHNLGTFIHETKKAGMYHTRYCTSGETHQPIKLDSRTALVFNGVIDMGTKKEMERRWHVSLKTDNDGEIFLKKCFNNHGADHPEHFLRAHPQVSFAGIVIEDNKLYAIRNDKRPLWMVKLPKLLLLASTQDIMKRAKVPGKYVELEPLKLYEWKI